MRYLGEHENIVTLEDLFCDEVGHPPFMVVYPCPMVLFRAEMSEWRKVYSKENPWVVS